MCSYDGCDVEFGIAVIMTRPMPQASSSDVLATNLLLHALDLSLKIR